MSFFYDLNNKLNAIRELPSTTHGQLNERDMSRAAKGYEKYGKEGMEALAKAGREGKALDPVRDKYNKYDESVEEGFGDVVKQVGSAAKKLGGRALNTLGHGDDADMIRDLQKKMGVPQTGMKPGSEPNPKQIKEKMSPAKAKSFAALAEPKDKITFADKIAGAKKEVDEMLGDVAAEAMKNALGGKKQVVASEEEDLNPFTNWKKPRTDNPRVGSVERGHKHDIEHTATGRKVTRRVDPAGISVGADDDKPADGEKRGRGRPKGPAKAPERVTGGATKHKGGRKTNEGENESDEIKQAMAMLKKAGYTVEKAAEQVDEKAVSKKQQRFMGMVHAAQKGEKPASKEVAKVAKDMGKKDAEDFAATKHKGLPEKKKSDDAPKKKKEKTQEAGGTDTPTASSGFSYGKGIYDSINREIEEMIAESMSVTMSMNNDTMNGGPGKNLTVNATDEDAVKLASILKMAGVGSGESSCGCGQPGCDCAQQGMDEAYGDTDATENAPDYPTDTETSADPFQYSGGINKPKSTGQTTVPVIASQEDRQHTYAEAEEDAIKRMMEMAGMSQNNRLDEGMMDKLKSMLVPKLMKLLGPDAEKIASAVKQATGGDLTPSKENAMKVVQALGIDKAAAQGQSPQMAEGIAGNWQGKLIQALYTLGLLGSAGAAASMWGTVGGSFMAVIGTLLLMFANSFFGDAPGQTGAMGKFGNKGTSAQRGLDDYGMPVRNMNVDEDDLARMMEMAGVKKKEVEEEKTDEGNKFTGNLAKARAAGKKEADLDGDGDMEKVRESIFDLTNQWRAYKG
jgi:hypothetical protein